MIDIKAKYQASIFANAIELKPNPDNITTLIELFRDKELIPSTFHELNMISPTPEPRIQLASSNGQWVISFGTNRIFIDKNPIDPKGENLGSLNEFALEAGDFFNKILGKYKMKSNRLSLVTHYLLKEMTLPTLSDSYLKLFKPFNFYGEHLPFEWDWRSATKMPIVVSEMSDVLNVITSIKRIVGQLSTPDSVIPFDRLQLMFDINTVQENGEYRFELLHVQDFLSKASNLHNSLLQEVQEYLNE
jgi:hypothetical protein